MQLMVVVEVPSGVVEGRWRQHSGSRAARSDRASAMWLPPDDRGNSMNRRVDRTGQGVVG